MVRQLIVSQRHMRNIRDGKGYIGLVVSNIWADHGTGTSSTDGTSACAQDASAPRSGNDGTRNWTMTTVMHSDRYRRLPSLATGERG